MIRQPFRHFVLYPLRWQDRQLRGDPRQGAIQKQHHLGERCIQMAAASRDEPCGIKLPLQNGRGRCDEQQDWSCARQQGVQARSLSIAVFNHE